MICALKLLTFLTVVGSVISNKPVYQTEIYLKTQPELLEHNICNGVIIHHRLILTTAGCLIIDIKPEVVQRVDPEHLYIKAGNKALEVYRNVESYEISKDFNLDRLENDIAILRLNESLPLGYRNDMKWIMIDDEFNLTDAWALMSSYNRNVSIFECDVI